MRTQLGIPFSAIVFVTVGTSTKYIPVGSLDFFSFAQKLLAELPEAYLIAVGPGATDAGWDKAVQRIGPRLVPVGLQQNVSRFHAAADVYLEGFPFHSHTALLEAAVSKLPVVRIPAVAPAPFSGHDFPLNAVVQPSNVDAYLAQAISLSRSSDERRAVAAALHAAVAKLQCGSAWTERLLELRKALPSDHMLYEISPVTMDVELDRFWAAYRMAIIKGNPLEFTIQLVKELNLRIGTGIWPLLKRYLGPFGLRSTIGIWMRMQKTRFSEPWQRCPGTHFSANH